jgi:CubicO group peptidase (beta-lactamase class C family)
MDETIVYKNNKIISHKINKLPYKKFTPNYLSKSYTPYKGNKHTIQSITKSILSLLFGIAIENKHINIDFVNEYIYKYFDNYSLDKKIKVKNLLTMTSGIEWNTNYDDPNNTTFLMEYSNDWIKFIMKQKMKNIPGKVFHYKDCDTVLLGHIFEKITNFSPDNYAKKYLFTPLKITAYWNKVNNIPDVEGGLYISSKSLLKIGELILNKGIYKNKQIISKKYYDLMIKNHMPKNTKHFFGYGYQWWLYDKIIFGWGYMGQYLVIIPEKNIIGVLLQWNNKKEIRPYEFIKSLEKFI